MIFDSMDYVETYDLGDDFEKAFKFLQDSNADFQDGRYEIDGDKVFALISSYDTKPMDDADLEVHRKYVDIQFLLEGEELIGYCPLSEDLDIAKDFDVDADAGMLVPPENGLTALHLTPGRFAIFFPNDAHMPCIAVGDPQPVKKVVVKIAV
jgi:biofilm protein TabA